MGIEDKAKELMGLIKKQDSIVIIAHGDADGVAGAAIAKDSLDEMAIDYEIRFVNNLNEKVISQYRGNFILFVDVGNGCIESIAGMNIDCVIVDHHFSTLKFKNSLNPFHFGIDGEREISASGLMHLIARNIKGNADIAIIGAIGDLQDIDGQLIGINRHILKESSIEIKRDIRIYGRSMPLYRMLSFSHLIPPFFRNFGMVKNFLKSMDIDGNKSWNELDKEEKRRLFSSIVKMLLKRGYDENVIRLLYGEVYEKNGVDLREIASVINSMAKYGEYEMAMDICLNGNYERAKRFLEMHRKNIRNGLKIAREFLNEGGVAKYFHVGNKIRDTILGTITGMLLESEGIEKPLLGFAESQEGIKISARAPKNMNINLSLAIQKAARKAGGYGGGHRAAAGAIIPRGYEEEFLRFFEMELANQSSSSL